MAARGALWLPEGFFGCQEGSVPARGVPAPLSGSAGSCGPFPERACPARAFLGTRSQRCWFGEPARIGGDWGEQRGAPAFLNPFPASSSCGHFHRDVPSREKDISSLQAKEEPRASIPLSVSSGKREGEEKFPAKSEAHKSQPHPSRVKPAQGCVC